VLIGSSLLIMCLILCLGTMMTANCRIKLNVNQTDNVTYFIWYTNLFNWQRILFMHNALKRNVSFMLFCEEVSL